MYVRNFSLQSFPSERGSEKQKQSTELFVMRKTEASGSSEAMPTEAAQTEDDAISGHPLTERSVPEISLSDLEIVEQLGEGASGVYRAQETWMWQSKECLERSAKQRFTAETSMSLYSRFCRDISLSTQIKSLYQLRHPCIIQLYGVVAESDSPVQDYIITGISAAFVIHRYV